MEAKDSQFPFLHLHSPSYPGRARDVQRPERFCNCSSMLGVCPHPVECSRYTSRGRYVAEILIRCLPQLSTSFGISATHRVVLYFYPEMQISNKTVWVNKKNMQLQYDCHLSYSSLPCHFGFDAFLGIFYVRHDANSIKEFFSQTCRATRVGQPLVFLLQQISSELRWRLSPIRVLAECDLVFSALWGPLHCYLAVEQRTWGCHSAWHQQRHWADSVSAERSQVEKGSFPLGWGDGNKTASERDENTGRQLELICTVTSSLFRACDIKERRDVL